MGAVVPAHIFGIFYRGVDGAGYTISNLSTNSSKGGLINSTDGEIKNLNIIIADEGMTGSGAVADYNDGNISNCVVKGNISGNSDYVGGICSKNTSIVSGCKYNGIAKNSSNTGATGGICGYNTRYLMSCKFDGVVENTNTTYSDVASGETGGICGYNNNSETTYPALIALCTVIGDITAERGYVGGISGNNYDGIKNCYFMGGISSNTIYEGGISGYNSYENELANITNRYTVPNGVRAGIGFCDANYTSNYYDKTISGLTDTSRGTPKSTVAMKMKQTYPDDWDFETVWGIDENINEGYPYLLREHRSEPEKEEPYTVNSVKILDLLGNQLEIILNDSFYFEINVTKNDNSKNSDSLIVAVYDENGVFIDIKYMSGIYYQNRTMTFGAMINKSDKEIGSIKGFVWNSISGMTPLSNAMGITN